jgi:cytochrome c-type protein NapB
MKINVALEKPMQKLILVLVMTTAFTASHGQETSTQTNVAETDNVTHGGQASLRGLTELDVTRKADHFKRIPKDRSPYVSDYIYQPPLIPHKIRGYEISANANKCLSCHSFKKSRDSGATKISVTHYGTRQGQVLSDVSPRRYFCLQCHVTQTDTGALIENDFKRVDSLQ